MITLAINWGYALLVTGMGMVTVFLLLILLIWIINLQTKLTQDRQGYSPQPACGIPHRGWRAGR